MFNFIIRHILGALLSLWIISMLIFFLSKAVPGDPVGGLKEVSESIYNLNYEKEYKLKATSLGLHLPSFYFSLVPGNFPENLNEVMPIEKKKYVKTLLLEGYQYNDIVHFKNVLDSSLNEMGSASKELANQTRILDTKYLTNLEIVRRTLETYLELSPKESGSSPNIELEDALNKLESNKKKRYFPSFQWHGFNNQYHIWISSLIRGKPRISRTDGKPVGKKISRALVWTVFMVLIALIFSYTLGIFLGLLLSNLKISWIKKWIERVLFGIYAIPIFWLATLLLVFFTTREYGTWTNIFPTVGLAPIDTGDPWYSRITAYGKQLILPCFILIIHNLAFVSTLVKRNVESYKNAGFVLMAKAYGFNDKEILNREIFPHTLLPLITSITSAIPTAIAGSLVIEIIFNIPGVGRLLYNSINTGDWPVVFAVVMLIALITIISFFIAEMLYRLADPRIKQEA